MRDTVGRLGLEQTIFTRVTDALKKLFALDPSKQWLDSVHIFSNMEHLGRIRLFVKTIRKFLVNLKRHHPDLHAGDSGHKGKSYQVQVMETSSPDKSQPDLNTHVQAEAAHHSDAQPCCPLLTQRSSAP